MRLLRNYQFLRSRKRWRSFPRKMRWLAFYLWWFLQRKFKSFVFKNYQNNHYLFCIDYYNSDLRILGFHFPTYFQGYFCWKYLNNVFSYLLIYPNQLIFIFLKYIFIYVYICIYKFFIWYKKFKYSDLIEYKLKLRLTHFFHKEINTQLILISYFNFACKIWNYFNSLK